MTAGRLGRPARPAKVMKHVWRDDHLRWEATTGVILHILQTNTASPEEVSPNPESTEELTGIYPSDVLVAIRKIAALYADSADTSLVRDASLLCTAMPTVSQLLIYMSSMGKESLAVINEAGKYEITVSGRDAYATAYSEFSCRVGIDLKAKDVDLANPLLKWKPSRSQDWGIKDSVNARLPPYRQVRERLTYRQWLDMIYTSEEVFIAAQTDAILGVVASSEQTNEWLEQLKPVKKFAKVVLSGGPEGVWVGKPLAPKDIHNDVTSFHAAKKPGITKDVLKGSSMAWELWESDAVSLQEYGEVRDWQDIQRTQRLLEKSFNINKSPLPVSLVKSKYTPKDQNAGPIDKAGERLLRSKDPDDYNMPMDASQSLALRVSDAGTLDNRKRCDFVYGDDLDAGDPGHIPYADRELHRCRYYAVPGSYRCEMHGGMIASTAETRSMIVAAQLQVYALSGQAVATLADIMLHGQNENVRLRAAETVLNRAGIVESADVDLSSVTDPTAKKDTASQKDAVLQRLERLAKYDADESERELKQASEIAVDVVATAQNRGASHADDNGTSNNDTVIDGQIVEAETVD